MSYFFAAGGTRPKPRPFVDPGESFGDDEDSQICHLTINRSISLDHCSAVGVRQTS